MEVGDLRSTSIPSAIPLSAMDYPRGCRRLDLLCTMSDSDAMVRLTITTKLG
jgi:hypothetical protein